MTKGQGGILQELLSAFLLFVLFLAFLKGFEGLFELFSGVKQIQEDLGICSLVLSFSF